MAACVRRMESIEDRRGPDRKPSRLRIRRGDGFDPASTPLQPAGGTLCSVSAGPGSARIGRYEVIKSIASGGMATVYRARHKLVDHWRRQEREERKVALVDGEPLVARWEVDLDAMLALSAKRDWDLAAADLILHEAGGLVTTHRGEVFLYNNEDARQISAVAAGPGLHPAIVARVSHINLPRT